MISARNLVRRFGPVTAGAGKTTTLRMLAGILDPDGGSLEVLGHRFPGSAETVKDRIGYMSQRFGLYPDLSVIENINFYADIFEVSGNERCARVTRMLEFSGLAPVE